MQSTMTRPTHFEQYRFLGDKRSQLVYDLDDPELDPAVVADILDHEAFVVFGPDTLDEARNRGYRAAGAMFG